MKTTLIIGLLLALVIAGVGSYLAMMWQAMPGSVPVDLEILVPAAKQPIDATFLIEGSEVGVEGGQSVPPDDTLEGDLGTPVRASVVQGPIVVDLNDDRAEDAAFVLAYDPGGSGTFVYLVVALKDGEGYVGTNGVLLGDRVKIDSFTAAHGIVTVEYRVHGEGQTMVEEPSQSKVLYATLLGAELTDIGPLREGESLFTGDVSGPEDEREFVTCDGATYTVSGTSRANVVLNTILNERLSGTTSAAFVVVTGMLIEQDTTATSSTLIDIQRVLSAPRYGACL